MLRCEFCDNIVGTTKHSESLVRLNKHSISINKPGFTTTFQSYAASVFICSQILSLIEATSLKKFVVHTAPTGDTKDDQPPGAEPLIIWIFNPDIYYSCSAYDGSGILPNITSDNATATNPYDDDTSQIYASNTVEMPLRSASQSDAKPEQPDEQSDVADVQASTAGSALNNGRNPNQDDTSQIYGSSQGPQIVSGDLEFEVPISDRHARTSADSSLPYVEPMTDTETPLISARSRQSTEFVAQPSLQSSQQVHGASKEHINLVHRAAKIFYKPLPTGEAASAFLDANSATHEELYLSSPAELAELRKTLERSNAMLPASAKVFQEWKVGLLDRYEKNPSGLGVMQENPLARGVKAKDGRVTRWSVGDGAEGLYS